MLKGNPGRRHLPAEVVTPVGEPDKPEGLSEAAGRIWDDVAPVLLFMGTLTKGDARAFATMCELQATLVKASSQKDAPGFTPFVVSQDFNGADVVKVHAALRLERETATTIRQFYEYFGMTPSARARMAVPKRPDEPVSKWAGQLK
jgi:P27 family predicted phage terminase small subunit